MKGRTSVPSDEDHPNIYFLTGRCGTGRRNCARDFPAIRCENRTTDKLGPLMSEFFNGCWMILKELYHLIDSGGYIGCGIAFVISVILLNRGVKNYRARSQLHGIALSMGESRSWFAQLLFVPYEKTQQACKRHRQADEFQRVMEHWSDAAHD
jgi:hypothetical protein